MSDKLYGGIESIGTLGYALAELTHTTPGHSETHARVTRDLARDLIAAQARIAELELDSRRMRDERKWHFDRADGLSHSYASVLRDSEATRAQLATAEATIAKLRELPDALVAEADALESGAYAMTRGSYDQALDRGKAQAKRDAAEAIAVALSTPAKGGE